MKITCVFPVNINRVPQQDPLYPLLAWWRSERTLVTEVIPKNLGKVPVAWPTVRNRADHDCLRDLSKIQRDKFRWDVGELWDGLNQLPEKGRAPLSGHHLEKRLRLPSFDFLESIGNHEVGTEIRRCKKE